MSELPQSLSTQVYFHLFSSVRKQGDTLEVLSRQTGQAYNLCTIRHNLEQCALFFAAKMFWTLIYPALHLTSVRIHLQTDTCTPPPILPAPLSVSLPPCTSNLPLPPAPCTSNLPLPPAPCTSSLPPCSPAWHFWANRCTDDESVHKLHCHAPQMSTVHHIYLANWTTGVHCPIQFFYLTPHPTSHQECTKRKLPSICFLPCPALHLMGTPRICLLPNPPTSFCPVLTVTSAAPWGHYPWSHYA